MFRKKFYYLIITLAIFALLGAGCVTNQETVNENGAVKGEAVTEETAAINADLIINSGDENNLYSLSVPQDSTVLNLLTKASDDYNLGLEVQDSTYGAFVQTLAGKAGGTDNKYWIYYINGESASVGVGEQIVQPSDQIEFRFE